MKIDDAEFEAIKLAVETDVTDPAFWHSRTPEERLVALELMRQRAYGYDEHSMPRIQKVFEVVKLKHDEPRPAKAEQSADPPIDQS